MHHLQWLRIRYHTGYLLKRGVTLITLKNSKFTMPFVLYYY